jgi:hypothetical protein
MKITVTASGEYPFERGLEGITDSLAEGVLHAFQCRGLVDVKVDVTVAPEPILIVDMTLDD